MKLVRDKILEHMKEKQLDKDFRITDGDDHIFELSKNLIYAVENLTQKGTMEDFAEVFEILLTLTRLHNYDLTELDSLRVDMLEKYGSYDTGVMVKETKK